MHNFNGTLFLCSKVGTLARPLLDAEPTDNDLSALLNQ